MTVQGSESVSVKDLWLEYLDKEKSRQIASTGQETALWRTGGRATKANPNKEDGTWWSTEGEKMLQRWADWRSGSHGWTIWVNDDGIPAIELGLTPTLGGVQVKMHIDRVMVTPDGELVILDLKTGQRTPSSDLQLAFYAAGMEQQLGVRPSYGTYWMAREGTTSPLVDLNFLSKDKVEEMIADFERARQARLFIPNLNNCKMCDLTKDCKWFNDKGVDVV